MSSFCSFIVGGCFVLGLCGLFFLYAFSKGVMLF